MDIVYDCINYMLYFQSTATNAMLFLSFTTIRKLVIKIEMMSLPDLSAPICYEQLSPTQLPYLLSTMSLLQDVLRIQRTDLQIERTFSRTRQSQEHDSDDDLVNVVRSKPLRII